MRELAIEQCLDGSVRILVAIATLCMGETYPWALPAGWRE